MKFAWITLFAWFLLHSIASAQPLDESSEQYSSRFLNAFGFYEPMYFALGSGKPDFNGDEVTYADFQVSFRFQLFSFYGKKDVPFNALRGFNFQYTQRSFWDLSSKSQPFFDTSFKPGAFAIWQYLGGDGMSWVHRIDLEAGYMHHSNGKDGEDSRFIDILYIKPTFVWRQGSFSHIFFTPKIWGYINVSRLNGDIQEYWGYSDLELTWRADFGLQLETHTFPAKNQTSFNARVTYPLDKLWKPLNFYLMIDYWNGAGETILRYDQFGSGFLVGIAISR